MRNKSLLYMEKDKSNENFLYFVFVFDIRINGKTALNGKKNNIFKKKILRLKNKEGEIFKQFIEEFAIIKTKYFIDEHGTPFIPNFFIETNSEGIIRDWEQDTKESADDIFGEYLSSCIFTKKDFEFDSVEDMFEHLKV